MAAAHKWCSLVFVHKIDSILKIQCRIKTKEGIWNVPFHYEPRFTDSGPTVEYKFGSKSLYLFSPDDVEKYRKELDIKEHNDNTIKQDFFDFMEERDYSLSYKMPFMLAIVKYIDAIGDAKIDDVLDDYIAFYQDRLRRGLQVDRSTCPYNEEMLKDRKAIRRSMLTNSFEKFERKRFLYYSKDLSVISMNHALYSQMETEDWNRVRMQLQEDLKNYYSEMGGV